MKSAVQIEMTVPVVSKRKSPPHHPLVMMTAYDTPSAAFADAAGVDIILVGDSLGMVVLGYEDTLKVEIQDMVRHTEAVSRARCAALVVADLPWLTYHNGNEQALQAAASLIRAGARAVKIEGRRPKTVRHLVDAGIPVMGHLGLTPQSVRTMGGFKVQARNVDQANSLVEAANELAEAGCFSIVVEGVPATAAAAVTKACPVPVIGIGAGPHCDGQVLVFHDLLGMGVPDGNGKQNVPRFVRQYADISKSIIEAISRFADDVRNQRFPSMQESYMGDEDLQSWDASQMLARDTVTTSAHNEKDEANSSIE